MKRIFTALTVAAVFAAGGALASNNEDKAALAAESIGIEQAIAKATERYPNGRILEAELEDDDGGMWELKVADSDGKVHKLYLDARTGEVQERKRK